MLLWQPGLRMRDVEKTVILAALKFYRCNKTETASSLGISIRTIDNKLKAYSMDIVEGELITIEGNTDGNDTEPRAQVEPVSKISKKRTMPLQERQEI